MRTTQKVAAVAATTGAAALAAADVAGWAVRVLGLVLLCCGQCQAAVRVAKNLAVDLLEMETTSDFAVASLLVFAGYTLQYVGSAGLFELTHPFGAMSASLSAKQRAQRREQVRKELLLGVGAMIANISVTMIWMRYIEPLVWTYGYFDRHAFSFTWFLLSIPIYMFIFDAWFYWTHRWLHDIPFLWDHVHRIHHQFKEPSAFAQDAVHPFEAILQGPLGHYLPTLFFPIHPIAHAAFGFLSSVFAVAAHDGRQWDINDHYYHHCAGKGRKNSFNYSLYWPLWDVWCNTRYDGPVMDRHALLKRLQ
ncbi:sterol desaturase [Salpingoeca rosetta]|uniref:Sterol desaturase n=1 Tax=Salpingoeca rosetta (strain ATCC 50818 / BSB-021) TaxID=946362 RepID=F2UJK5_SALR5|nr:sterol desaturase [Salpingoeca rosetta]EGD77304.1 sterol desaturase [Salpingoeca rosetta]|eukprot:XP_004990648.1 sterol desaturase [Salpingoeca rosetta]